MIHDIHQSPFWRDLYSLDGQFHGDLRAVSFGLCTDGMNPFVKEKVQYSMLPIMLTILNLPNYIRIKHSSILLVGIIPGSKEPKNIDPYLELIIEEIASFSDHEIFDSYNNVQVKLQASIVLNILDYPGQNKVLKCTGMLQSCLYIIIHVLVHVKLYYW